MQSVQDHTFIDFAQNGVEHNKTIVFWGEHSLVFSSGFGEENAFSGFPLKGEVLLSLELVEQFGEPRGDDMIGSSVDVGGEAVRSGGFVGWGFV